MWASDLAQACVLGDLALDGVLSQRGHVVLQAVWVTQEDLVRAKVKLEDLWEELQKGEIYQCSLRDPSGRFQIDGLSEGSKVYVDPRPATLETLIHELLHRRKPKLSERTVTITAHNLAIGMDDATKLRWWKRYNRLKKNIRPVEA